MSLLSRRSGSQRSYLPGNDEITVRKVLPNGEECRTHSDSPCSDTSKSSVTSASNFTLDSSCVARKFPNHKSSHLRFLAWVAYTRKFTGEPITEDERRTCPLLWCRSVFRDQEEMLQHVWNCEHLSKGLYWCFHCQKPERVGKFQCKRCEGLPSRTDRLATVAKRIFSKLGSKNHLIQRSPRRQPEMSLGKVSEASKAAEEYRDRTSSIYDAGPVGDWERLAGQELPTVIDNPDIAGGWASDFQELPDTQICEMTGSGHPIELSASKDCWVGNNYSSSKGSSWHNQNSPGKESSPAFRPAKRPDQILPALTTQSISSQGQYFPAADPNGWSEGPLIDTLVSPLSTIHPFASPFHDVSPTDTEASGKSFFTDSGYASGTIGSCATSPPDSSELNPAFNEPRGMKRSWDCTMAFEELSHNDTDPTVMAIQPASIFSGMDQQIAHSASSSHSPSRCPSTSPPRMQSPYWSSPVSLVQSFSDVLDAHIYHTKGVLRDLPSTPITTELLAMSRSSMVSIGLEALVGVIEGRYPTAIVQAFAFAHISYACAIAVDHDDTKVHTQEWFRDSLSWVAGLGSTRQRNRYVHIAKAVWQPSDSLRESSLPKLLPIVDNENRLFLACKRFLDILESLSAPEATSSRPADTTTEFPSLLFAQEAQTQVIEPLIKTPSIEAFIEDVVKVERRLHQHHVTSIRELELELMCAGKLASQSELAYARFLSHVTALCDPLYESSPQQRTTYRLIAISQIKRLISEEIYSEHDDEDVEFELELDDDLPLGIDMDMLGQVGCSLQGRVDESVRDNSQSSHDFPNPSDSEQTVTPIKQPDSQQDGRFHSRMPNPPPPSTTSSSHATNRIGLKPKLPSTVLSSPSPLPPSEHSAFESAGATTSSSSLPANITPSQPKDQLYQCPRCPYLPSGIEKYKASNLRRHKRTQHPSADAKGSSYMCTWPGCGRSFTRSDNLMSHKKSKGHIVEFGVRGVGSGGDKTYNVEGKYSDHQPGEHQLGSDLEDDQRAAKRTRRGQ